MPEFEPLQTMRFQSQLGKEMKRKYKEGNNLVTLSLADVVKVNYKYNTVDVITVRDNNSTTKNPNDNGKYSAMLPTHMSGRTANGNIYGSTTLVTVGTRVLIGFIDGRVDTPIVINVYGKTDDQQQLTRTEFTAADDSIESIQQELWNTFNLYPSMTYDNIDGRGNREITFSGKTFLIATDRDQENNYVQDAHFDYMDLPHSRYANGELIEPESPDAPTMLFVHQSIYDNHRTTFFVKSDGTFRLGSRHKDGGGITYQELKPDGSYSIVKKNDTENPEEESFDLSSIEILKDGNVVLQNPSTKMEITDEGVLVNGKPIGSGGGGGIDPELDKIIKQINNQLTMLEITITEVEGGLETKVSKDTYYIDTAEIEARIKEIKDEARKSKGSLQKAIEDLVTYTGNSVNNNITDEQRLKVLSMLDDIDNKKTILDGSTSTIMTDPFLTDDQKQAVKKWADKLNSDHIALKTTVMAAIQDKIMTAQDRTDIAKAAETYLNDLNSWLVEVDKAADASQIERVREAAENAVNYANKESLHQSAVLTQLYNMVSIKVSSEQITQQFIDLDMKITDVQNETGTKLDDIQKEIDNAVKNLPYRVEVSSSKGMIFVNGLVNSTISAKITKGPDDVTSTIPVADFVWSRVSNNTAADTAWNTAHKNSGRSFNINAADVTDRATFFCDYKAPPIATGSVTIANIQDITVGTTEPTNPRDGALWYDKGTGIVWLWQSGQWNEINRFDVGTRNLLIGSSDYGSVNTNNPTDPNNTTPNGTVSGGWRLEYSKLLPKENLLDTMTVSTNQTWGGVDYLLGKVLASGTVAVGDKITYSCMVRTFGGTTPNAEITMRMFITDIDGTTTPYNVAVKANQKWQEIYATAEVTQKMMDTVANNADRRIRFEPIDIAPLGTGGTVETRSHIVVKGIVPAPWVPAPEDTKRDSDNADFNMNALGNDSYLTRFERSLVKSKLGEMTGVSLLGTQEPPTVAQMDANTWNKGSFYAIRKQARDIAIDVLNDQTYKDLEKAYNELVVYLKGVKTGGRNNVFPWDTTSDTIMDVKRTDWDKFWNAYDSAYALLTVLVQKKQKEYTENKIEDVNQTIKDISKSGQHKLVDLTTPTTSISSPISTLALPMFKGNTENNLKVGGSNLVLGTIKETSVAGLGGDVNKENNQTVNIYKFSTGATQLMSTKKFITGFSWKIEQRNASTPVSGTMYMQGSSPYPLIANRITFTPDNMSGVYLEELNPFAAASAGFTHINLRLDKVYGTVTINNVIIAVDTTVDTIEYSPRPNDGTAETVDEPYYNRNRAIAGVTMPNFYTARSSTDPTVRSSMTIQDVFHGDGTNRDEFKWLEDGTPTKVNRFADALLDTGYFINVNNTAKVINSKRYRQVELLNAMNRRLANNGKIWFANHRGEEMERLVGSTNITKPNQFFVDYAKQSINFLIADEDINVTAAFNLRGEDVAFFMRGWKMYQGEPKVVNVGGKQSYTFDAFTGAGSAAPSFTPINYDQNNYVIQNNTFISTTYKRPVDLAPTMSTKQTSQQWQVVYQLESPFESYCSFTGAIDIIADPDGAHPTAINYAYVDWTPPFNNKDGQFMYGTNLATVQEDTRYLIPVLERRLANAEQKVETDSIKSVVFSSREYELGLKDKANVSDLGDKADKDALKDYATKNDLDVNSAEYKQALEEAMKNIDFSPYVQKSEIEQLDRSWTARFFSSGGMNVVKNSIAFAKSTTGTREYFSYWDDLFDKTAPIPSQIQTNELDALGFSSGFMFDATKASGKRQIIAQVLNVIPNQPYIVSYYLKKMTGGTTTDFDFVVEFQRATVPEPTSDAHWVRINGAASSDIRSTVHSGYTPLYFPFTPDTDKVRMVITAGAQCTALISGIMVHIGDKPIKWTMATGENYNTNVRMNLDGIRVSQMDDKGNEVGFTIITPKEFAGYYIRDGKPERIFNLNGDETWTKKLRAEEEINMGPIKILRVESTDNAGWAFISNN